METQAVQIHSLELFCGITNYIDNERLYYSYFKKIPTIKTISGINTTRLRKWLAITTILNRIYLTAQRHSFTFMLGSMRSKKITATILGNFNYVIIFVEL